MNLLTERKFCPACNCNDHSEIINLNWNDPILVELFKYRNFPLNFVEEGSYKLLECKECSLIYQAYSPTKKLSDLIYNKWLVNRNLEKINIDDKSFNPYSSKKTIRNISEVNQFLGLISKNPEDCKVFDFGMGWGAWCKAAQLMGVQAYGTEITESQIKYNKAHGLNVLNWDQIHSFKFDFINTEQVLEHVDQPYDILKHLIVSLEPKGFLKISVPNGSSVKSNINKNFKSEWFYAKGQSHSLNPVEPLQHLNSFNHKSLNTMCSKLGLKKTNLSFGKLEKNDISPLKFTTTMQYILSNILPIHRYYSSRATNLLFQKM